MELADVIKPVNLGCTSNYHVDTIAIENGLMHNKDENLASILQYAPLKTISLLECTPFLPIVAFRKTVIYVKGEWKQSICYAIYLFCHGDSGAINWTQKSKLSWNH